MLQTSFIAVHRFCVFSSLVSHCQRLTSTMSRMSGSGAVISEQEKRLDDEIQQLLVDIRRIGDEPGSPRVKFGELFDDDDVQQYYEALVGTLKSAKKRGFVDFKGQMLLKGMHDNVVISITKEAEELRKKEESKEESKGESPIKE